MTKKVVMIIMLFGFFLFVGCAKKDDVPENTQQENNDIEIIEENEPEEPTFTHVFPFTGIGTNEGADRRPVGVMVNNHVAARPQSGLSKADITFEILAEGSITRFLAIFQSEQPEIVGPVRSARPYYFELAENYDALYIYHGAANFINDMIINQGIDHLSGANYDNDGHLFKRESFRKAPHNSYLLFDAVYDVSESKGYDIISDTKALPFVKEDAVITGDPGTHVQVLYPGRKADEVIEYIYDETKQAYTRHESKQQTVELDSEEPIFIHNVFIIETAHKVIDDEGRREIDLKSGGNAYLMQKGQLQKLAWKNEDGRIIPVQGDESIGFVPGKTWVNVVPTNPGLETAVTIFEE